MRSLSRGKWDDYCKLVLSSLSGTHTGQDSIRTRFNSGRGDDEKYYLSFPSLQYWDQ